MKVLSRFQGLKRDKIVPSDTKSSAGVLSEADRASIRRGATWKGRAHDEGGPAMSATTTPVAPALTSSRPASSAPAEAPASSPSWERLEEQIGWYSKGARRNRRWYLRIKLVQIVSAAAIPVLAATSLPTWVAGGLGALIVVLESVQQLFQFHSNWTHYRSTSEALKHEKYLYVAQAGAYATAKDPACLLAERVESRVSQEHAAWATEQQHQPKGGQEG